MRKFVWALAGLLALTLGPLPALAAPDTITITGIVPPLRTIIVDQNQTITEIMSNSSLPDAALVAVLGSPTGPTQPVTLDLRLQYNQLLPQLDLARPGIVYQRPLFTASQDVMAYLQTLLLV